MYAVYIAAIGYRMSVVTSQQGYLSISECVIDTLPTHFCLVLYYAIPLYKHARNLAEIYTKLK